MRVILTTGSFPESYVGGAERQTLLLAQGLTSRGHDVLYVATNAGVDMHEEIRGVQVRKLPGRQVVGNPGHDKMFQSVVDWFKPDICYARWIDEFSYVMHACGNRQIPTVAVLGSFKDTTPLYGGQNLTNGLKNAASGYSYRHWQAFRTMRNAAVVVCNTQELAKRARRWLRGVDVRTIYNGSPIPAEADVKRETGRQIIWVNNIKEIKRPEVFIDLARALPVYDFLMVGSRPTQGRYAARCQALLDAAPSNLNYIGKQPMEEVDRLISHSDLLLYTSKAEGFGNSFLQAWMYGVPTGSLDVTLDGILEREQIGFVAHSFEQLVGKTEALMASSDKRLQMGRRAHTYAVKYHSTSALTNAFETLFAEIYERSQRQTFERHKIAV